MGFMTINGKRVEFTDEKNILSIIRKAGIDIPTLCYHSELPTFGACRLCTVEDERGRTFASCSETPRDGMVIYTNTPKLRKYRKLIVELLLASHCRDCTTCSRSGNCTLQEMAQRLHVRDIRFENTRKEYPIDRSSPSIIRNPNKCILCGNCVRTCREIQGIEAIGFAFRGTDSIVTPAFGKPIAETECVNCGQCRVTCPTGAIFINNQVDDIWKVLSDPTKRVVAQIAPAVRIAVGDTFGIPKGTNVMGKIVSALHLMGFEEVYDTAFSADLTIMEEADEFLNRLQTGKNLPLLTSCCPAWVKFCEEQFPEFTDNISSCRSPQGMLSASIKEYFRDPEYDDGRETIMVSFMPCTAKKMEKDWERNYTKGLKDTDYVVTTTELVSMIRTIGYDFATLEPDACDVPFGLGSGAGVIFGNSGGVTEAVLRRLIPSHDKETLRQIANSGVRDDSFIKEFTIPYDGIDVKACVVSGLADARKVMDKVRSGEANYHIIEVMACRRGCIMGGGQPLRAGNRTKAARKKGLYNIDNVSFVKKSDENPMVISLYNGLLKGKEHELLHVHKNK